MKLAIEPFLLDNAMMNACVYLLTAAWLGIRLKLLPTALASLLGAVYALLSLFVLPMLKEPYLKLPAFLLGSLPLFRRAGPFYRTLPVLLLSAATVGGAALLLTLLLGGSVSSDGTLMGTVTLRSALASVLLACCLPRIFRALFKTHRRRALYTEVVIELNIHTFRLRALIDSGNLLTEPVSGLPVILIDRSVDAPTRPIPYADTAQGGVLFGERARCVHLPAYGGAEIDCYIAASPEKLGAVQAILPESLLPQEWRTKDVQTLETVVVAPVSVAARWQKRYLLVHSHQRGIAGAARSGRRSVLHCTRTV